MNNIRDERFRRGWERLLEVDAESGERVVDSLQDVAPDLGRYVVEFAYGDIYGRPALDLASGSSSRSPCSPRSAVRNRSSTSTSTRRSTSVSPPRRWSRPSCTACRTWAFRAF
jgi:hypothetical protein